MEILGDIQRGASVSVAVQKQRRDVDARKDISQVRSGEGGRDGAHSRRMKVTRNRDCLVDQLRRGRVREDLPDESRHPLTGREVEFP